MRRGLRLTALGLIAAGCSNSTAAPSPIRRSILFTNTLPAEYVAVAFDTLVRASFDTSLLISAGGRACLTFDLTRLGGDVVALESTDISGYVFRRVFVNVLYDSWAWDGATNTANMAPRC